MDSPTAKISATLSHLDRLPAKVKKAEETLPYIKKNTYKNRARNDSSKFCLILTKLVSIINDQVPEPWVDYTCVDIFTPSSYSLHLLAMYTWLYRF